MSPAFFPHVFPAARTFKCLPTPNTQCWSFLLCVAVLSVNIHHRRHRLSACLVCLSLSPITHLTSVSGTACTFDRAPSHFVKKIRSHTAQLVLCFWCSQHVSTNSALVDVCLICSSMCSTICRHSTRAPLSHRAIPARFSRKTAAKCNAFRAFVPYCGNRAIIRLFVTCHLRLKAEGNAKLIFQSG